MIKVCTATLVLFFVIVYSYAQKHVPLPHGSTFGVHVDTLQNMPASKLEAFMGKMPRIATTIHGKVLKVDKTKGGWFQLDAGSGKIIKVHFKNYGVNIPADLKGRNVMIQGVAQKQIIADDMQHFAGNTQDSKKQNQADRSLSFEATGLMVL